MELKVVMKVGLVLFVMGLFTATSVDARFDSSSFIPQLFANGGADYSVKSTTTACCDFCICTRSYIPQCQCRDIRDDGCHSACKNCIVMQKYPPSYVCADITNFCYDKCDSSKAKAH